MLSCVVCMCVCVCVCVCVCAHVSTYMTLCMWYMCAHVCTYVHGMCMCVHTYKCPWMYIRTCACIRVFVHVSRGGCWHVKLW